MLYIICGVIQFVSVILGWIALYKFFRSSSMNTYIFMYRDFGVALVNICLFAGLIMFPLIGYGLFFNLKNRTLKDYQY